MWTAVPTSAALPLWRFSWWTLTKNDIANGRFRNMRSAIHPGTKFMDPYDAITYKTMDLGRSLHCIYWLAGKTLADVRGRLELKWVYDDNGQAWTENGAELVLNRFDWGWNQPKLIANMRVV